MLNVQSTTQTKRARSLSLRLVAHEHGGELRFSTEGEYASWDSTGDVLWRGDVVVSASPGSLVSSGCMFVPEIAENLTHCIAHRAAELRVIVEGREIAGTGSSLH